MDLAYFIPEIKNGDILLVLGVHMGIRDIGTSTYQWLIEEIALMKRVLCHGVGLIGVSLGAQLIVYASGVDDEMHLEEILINH